MKRKAVALISVLLILVISTISFAGCTKNEEPTADEKQSANKENLNEEKEESLEPITLSVLGFKQGSELGTLPDIIDNFSDEYPYITVEYEGIATTNGYDTVVSTRLAAGENIDVFMTGANAGGNVAKYYEAGYLEDLTNEDYAKRLNESLKPLASADGKIVSMYSQSEGLGLFANVDLLKKYDVEFPENWNEFVNACDKIKASGGTAMIMGNKNGWSAFVFACIGFYSDLKNNDEIETIGQNILDGKVTYTEKYLPPYQKLKELIDNEYFNAEESLGQTWNQETLGDFINGKGAFMIGGSWQVAQILNSEEADIDIQFGPLPNQDTGVANAILLPSVPYSIYSKTKHMKESKLFLSYIFKDENIKSVNESQSAFSVISGIELDLVPEVDLFNSAILKGNSSSFSIAELVKYDVHSECKAVSQKVVIGEITPEEAANELQEFYEKQRLLKD